MRSGKGLARTDGFQVSSNLDVRRPQRARLPQVAAGNDIAGAPPANAINATALKDTASKRRRAGPSACKRKEARTAQEVPTAIDDEVESADKDADIAPDDDDNAGPTTPEVSDDEGGVHSDNEDSAKSVTLRPTTKSQPPASAENVIGGRPPASTRSTTGGNDESEGDKTILWRPSGTSPATHSWWARSSPTKQRTSGSQASTSRQRSGKQQNNSLEIAPQHKSWRGPWQPRRSGRTSW
jgi:hypothetical protein